MNEKDLKRAEWLRNQTLDFLKNYSPNYHVHCPSCNRDQVEKLEQDRQYHIRAYQQMTPEQILMSQEREVEVQHKEVQDYLKNYEKEKERRRKAEEQARKSRFLVRVQE